MATKQGKRKNVLPVRPDTKSLLVRDILVTDARYAVARWASFTVKSGRPLISNLKKKKNSKRKKQGAFLLSHLKRPLFSKTLPGVEFFVIAGRKRAVFKPMISYIKSTVIAC